MVYKALIAAVGQSQAATPNTEAHVATAKPLASFYDAWRANMHTNGLTESTAESYVYDVERFAVWLAKEIGREPTIFDPQEEVITRYRDVFGASRSARTVSLMLGAVRSYHRYLIKAKVRLDDPTLHVVYPKIDRDLPGRALSRMQVRELLAALVLPNELTPSASWQWQRNRRIVYTMLYAGLRIGEIRTLRRRDLQFSLGFLDVRDGKGAKDRTVPMHPVLLAELAECDSWKPAEAICGKVGNVEMADKSLHHVFERWIPEKLKLDFRFSSHDLRHTFCQTMIEEQGELAKVQECMGHDDPKTTGAYYRLHPEHLRPTIYLLPAVW